MRLIYVTPATFPDSSAGTARMVGVARALEAEGMVVDFLGSQAEPADATLEAQGLKGHVSGAGVLSASASRGIRAYKALTLGKAFIAKLDALHRERPINAVITYGGGVSLVGQVRRWARKKKIPVVVDSVEWYEPSHVQLGRYGPFRLDHELCMRWVYPRVGNVMAISRYLEEYFRTKGASVVRVPPILDVARFEAHEKQGRSLKPRLRLAYTGSPGRKDLLDVMLKGVLAADPDGTRIVFDIAGPSAEDLRRLLPSIDLLPNIHAHGRVPPERAIRLVGEANFTVLLRTSERYALAGFSSKVPQSFAVGTPIIANHTGELHEYIRDGHTGLVVSEPTVAGFADTLHRALTLDVATYAQMRTLARIEAEKSFDIRSRGRELRAFFESLE